MVNGMDYWDLVHEIVRGIAAEYDWQDYIHERTPAKVDHAVYGGLVGRYEIAPDFVLTIATDNGRLLLKESEAELLPESETKFLLMDGRRVTSQSIPSWNQIIAWLREMETLRKAAA